MPALQAGGRRFDPGHVTNAIRVHSMIYAVFLLLHFRKETVLATRLQSTRPALQARETTLSLLSLPFISNNLGHLLFSQRLTPMTRTDRVWNSSATAGAPAFSDCGTPPHRSSGSEPKRLHHVQNSHAPIGRQKFRSTRLARSRRVFQGSASVHRLLEPLRESCP
jgi:hypothetical protein